MLHQLTRLFQPSAQTHYAYHLYASINEESRQERFFTEWRVPDTLDGRFELILIHMFLYLHRIKQEPEDTTKLQQRLIEAFFEDMDRSIRELGVGDTGVSKRVKHMANAFYGRIHAYTQALEHDEALEHAIYTNLYGTLDEQPDDVSMVCRYMHEQIEAMKSLDILNMSFSEGA